MASTVASSVASSMAYCVAFPVKRGVLCGQMTLIIRTPFVYVPAIEGNTAMFYCPQLRGGGRTKTSITVPEHFLKVYQSLFNR